MAEEKLIYYFLLSTAGTLAVLEGYKHIAYMSKEKQRLKADYNTIFGSDPPKDYTMQDIRSEIEACTFREGTEIRKSIKTPVEKRLE